MVEDEWSPRKQGETMRQKFTIPISFAISILAAPGVISAQQRGTANAVPMVAPARPTPVVAAPAMMRAPVRPAAPAAPAHPTAHGFVPSAHPSAPRFPGHPTMPKAPARNHPVQANPTRGNGHFFASYPTAVDDNGVPGLGFDYPHYAATHPNAGRNHSHDGSVFPFIGGGIYIPAMGYVDNGSPMETDRGEAASESQVEATEAAEPSELAAVAQAPAAPSGQAKSNSPLAPAAEYIFVRRDGSVFFAVAYSWVNGHLQYITRDGFRKLVSAATLDLDATTQFNEQRGVAFRSPA